MRNVLRMRWIGLLLAVVCLSAACARAGHVFTRTEAASSAQIRATCPDDCSVVIEPAVANPAAAAIVAAPPAPVEQPTVLPPPKVTVLHVRSVEGVRPPPPLA